MRTRIVLADDHELVRESIASLLREVPDFEVVGQSANGRQLLELVERLHPDVAVVDVSMPELNGVEAARRLRNVSQRTRVIALSAYTDEAYIRDLIDAGVVAYIIKSGAAKDLIQAIRTASRGRVYFSREIMGVVDQIGSDGRAVGEYSTRPLSQREREILQLVAEGKSSKEIAASLGIGETTVKTHRNNIMSKLNVRDIAGLTRHAIKLKLVTID
jgi:two-component system, NarL family, response regulator NreC